MPISKHHQKKYPNSEWVRRRNIRRAATKRASRLSLSEQPVAMASLKKSTENIHKISQKTTAKNWFQGMKNVFADRIKSLKDVV